MAATRGRPALEALDAVLRVEPPPMVAPALPKLRELARAARAWREEYVALMGPLPAAGAAGGGEAAAAEDVEERPLVPLAAMEELGAKVRGGKG